MPAVRPRAGKAENSAVAASLLVHTETMSDHQQAKPLGDDPHSWANFKHARVTHYDIVLRVDFHRQIFHGHVDVTASVLADNTDRLLLDFKALAISSVTDLNDNNATLLWTVPQNHSLCACLSIPIAEKQRAKGSVVKVRIHYSTSPESGAIQWLEPSQTSGKKHPFVYTQCEAILARSLLPCQDTPAVKAPYDIKVTVPSPLVAACSGTPTHNGPQIEEDGWLSYSYHQKNPIPAYLIAIVAGALVKAPVGPRSSVWCEKQLLNAAVHEFSEDTEKFIQAGEFLTGVKYEWGVYDMVVLPGAFPYGGMENPNLTFLSSSLLAGDRSLTNVVAHEITHSWAGNLVTNSSWKDFWLNEGFTVYIERMILGRVHNSEAYRHFESLCGYNDLIKTVADFGEKGAWCTKLQPEINGIDPDEVFSKVPYEKGSLFLLYLETQIVGGQDAMLGWLRSYFPTFANKALSTEEMKAHFLNHFTNVHKVDPAKLNSIDWNLWLTGTGLPAVFDPRNVLQKTLSEKCQALASLWKEHEGKGAKSDDLAAFQSKQTMFFLDLLITQALPLKHEVIEHMDSLYHLSKSKNVEISFRYFIICLKSKYTKVYHAVGEFLSRHGRGLYVRPLYRALNEVDHAVASKIYKENRSFYHSVIRNMFDPILLH